MKSPLHILHLEDEPNDARLIQTQLADSGLECTITVVDNRTEFLARLEHGWVDLVLSDYAVPGFDGMAALKVVRERWPMLPFVLVSGTFGEEVAVESLKNGATDYVLKDGLARLAPVVLRAMAEQERELERRRAEVELRWKTALLEAQVNASIDGILVVDEHARKLVQNERMAELWHLPPHIMENADDEAELAFILEQVREPAAFLARVRHLYAHPNEISRDEIERKDGTVLDRYSAPVQGKHGKPYGRIWVFRDITPLKQTEAQLRKLSQAVEQSPAMVVITDLQGSIEYVNPKFSHVTGYAFAEVAGQNPRLLKSGKLEPGFYRELWSALNRGEDWQGEFHNRKKNGELYWERATISPIRSERGVVTHFLAIKEDITEYKRLEEQFRQAQKMEAVGRLAAGVAHDFNNLLTVILGYSDILLGEAGVANGLRDSLVEVKNAGERAAGLTRQLLAFSRQQLLEPREVDLNETVSASARMLQRLVGEDIILELQQDPDLPHVLVDPGQLEQAIMNLVVNARDAIPQFGKITVTTSQASLPEADGQAPPGAHPGTQPGRQVVLTVADTGCGMDEATLGRIYEPFFSTKEPGKGTGLGLAMVFGFIQQSGGFIGVTSAPGQGTTFKIQLPALLEAGSAGVNGAGAEPLPAGTETILLVEDEAGVRQLGRRLLEARGYTVLEAARGDEALRLAETHAGGIDLLLTDVVMPGMGGGQLVAAMRTLRPEVKILLVSGYSGDALHRHGGVSAGMNLLAKPFTASSLALRVREVLDNPDSAAANWPSPH